MPPEKGRARAIVGNMHRNLVKFGRAVFELCERTNTQTDRQTHKQMILRNPKRQLYLCSSFDKTPAYDGWTDRQTQAIAYTALA